MTNTEQLRREINARIKEIANNPDTDVATILVAARSGSISPTELRKIGEESAELRTLLWVLNKLES